MPEPEQLELVRRFDADERGVTQKVDVRLPQRWAESLKFLADREGTTLSDLLRSATREWLMGVESFGPSEVDRVAAVHALSVAEAETVLRLADGGPVGPAVGWVKSQRSGPRSVDSPALYGSGDGRTAA